MTSSPDSTASALAGSVPTLIVDLNHFRTPGVRVFSGRERGRLVREACQLDKADQRGQRVEVHIPEDVFSVAHGFLSEMIGPSVPVLGADVFRQRYRLVGAATFDRSMEEVISAWTNTSSPLSAAVAGIHAS